MKSRPSVQTLMGAGLMNLAAERTRLHDFDDEGLEARLDDVVNQLTAMKLSARGEFAATETMIGLLEVRLRLLGDRATHPIGEEAIEQPLIVTGEPRTGTTMLHTLIGEDPGARSVRFWEAMYPSPPPRISEDSTLHRRARANVEWAALLEQIPSWLISHPYNDLLGDGPAECERLWAMDFRAAPTSAWWRVPFQRPPRPEVNHASQYRFHKYMLQQLQYRDRPMRWALKGTSHHHRLAALFEAYPDAHVVWIHRDPVRSAASRVELLSQLREGMAGSIDRPAFAAEQLEEVRRGWAQLMADPVVDDERILHLRYADSVKDPVAAVRRIYEHFSIEFTAQFEKAMDTWIAGNRVDRYGRFTYRTEDLGVDTEKLYVEWASYMERFGLTRE